MKNLALIFASLMLVSCILEPESPVGGGGGNALTITLPGGFSVASTRLSDTEEQTISSLHLLVYAGGTLKSVHEVDIAKQLVPVTGTTDQYSVTGLYISAGTYRIVALANAADLNIPAFYTPAPGEVIVGGIAWATTNSIPSLGGTATFQSTPYIYDGANQLTWHEATSGIAGSSAGVAGQTGIGVCAPGWRLPTEYVALMTASNNISTAAISGDLTSGGYYINNKGWGTPSGGISGTTVTFVDGQSLFLSASGNTGGVNREGEYTNYWTSTQSSSSSAPSLFSDSGSLHPTNSVDKTAAFSIRCVRDVVPDPAEVGVGDLVVEQTYDDMIDALEGSLAGRMYPDGGSVPMWGEDEITVAGGSASADIRLHRAVARIDVGVGEFESGAWGGLPGVFEMTSVTVVSPNDMYSVVPLAASIATADDTATVGDDTGKPVSPSIPSGATQFSVEDSVSKFTYIGSAIANTIYVPEATIVGTAFDSRMALVVGGHYNGDNSKTCYYRVDFEDADGLKNVVRNHLYKFSVKSVNGAGSPSVAQAYASVRSDMTVSVVGWTPVQFNPNL